MNGGMPIPWKRAQKFIDPPHCIARMSATDRYMRFFEASEGNHPAAVSVDITRA